MGFETCVEIGSKIVMTKRGKGGSIEVILQIVGTWTLGLGPMDDDRSDLKDKVKGMFVEEQYNVDVHMRGRNTSHTYLGFCGWMAQQKGGRALWGGRD
jgi:hypothetical protein